VTADALLSLSLSHCEVSDHTSVGVERSPLRILLVDDSVMIQKTTGKALRNKGYDVDIAGNGAEGLKKYEASYDSGKIEDRYDIILTDLQVNVTHLSICIITIIMYNNCNQ
jgi:PleD family two-component response regulator